MLLLAVGCDNFYRAAPECVNLLFVAYFCEYRLADPKARVGRRTDVCESGGGGATHDGGSSGERPADTMRPESIRK